MGDHLKPGLRYCGRVSLFSVPSADLFFDGSCEPVNPGGRAVGGYVIIPETGEQVKGCSVIAENSTNNIAEFGALMLGLRKALDIGIDDLRIRGDSMLVIKLITGRWKARKVHICRLLAEARGLLQSFGNWEASWIPRAQNAEADALSSSLQTKTRDWTAYKSRRRRSRRFVPQHSSG